MKIRLGICLAGLCSSAVLHADPAAWRVVGDGGEVVLLGSVHYLREADHPLPALIDRLYADADRLVMELDLDDLDASVVQAQFLRAAMLPASQSLRDVLGERTYSLARSKADALGIDLDLLARFEPWLVAITMLDLGMGQLGYRSDRGLEQYLLGKSATDGKEVLGLETLETQTAIFDSLDASGQRALLEQTLDELDSADEAMDEMVDAWRDGNLDSLTDSLMSDFDDFPGLYDALVTNRNRAWVTEIETLLDDGGNYLIVVGALHLVGTGSVVELLEDRGHPVIAVH
jgi:uncharacterized protein YbaP (TraB family)